mmetsp:Transcript_50547/g.110601  ORF Transcript_50547/g.110601 Transcript_50547/m.110601 type:complete len:233 (-) Transcript_50547:1698-2396(-)
MGPSPRHLPLGGQRGSTDRACAAAHRADSLLLSVLHRKSQTGHLGRRKSATPRLECPNRTPQGGHHCQAARLGQTRYQRRASREGNESRPGPHLQRTSSHGYGAGAVLLATTTHLGLESSPGLRKLCGHAEPRKARRLQTLKTQANSRRTNPTRSSLEGRMRTKQTSERTTARQSRDGPVVSLPRRMARRSPASKVTGACASACCSAACPRVAPHRGHHLKNYKEILDLTDT